MLLLDTCQFTKLYSSFGLFFNDIFNGKTVAPFVMLLWTYKPRKRKEEKSCVRCVCVSMVKFHRTLPVWCVMSGGCIYLCTVSWKSDTGYRYRYCRVNTKIQFDYRRYYATSFVSLLIKFKWPYILWNRLENQQRTNGLSFVVSNAFVAAVAILVAQIHFCFIFADEKHMFSSNFILPKKMYEMNKKVSNKCI